MHDWNENLRISASIQPGGYVGGRKLVPALPNRAYNTAFQQCGRVRSSG